VKLRIFMKVQAHSVIDVNRILIFCLFCVCIFFIVVITGVATCRAIGDRAPFCSAVIFGLLPLKLLKAEKDVALYIFLFFWPKC